MGYLEYLEEKEEEEDKVDGGAELLWTGGDHCNLKREEFQVNIFSYQERLILAPFVC